MTRLQANDCKLRGTDRAHSDRRNGRGDQGLSSRAIRRGRRSRCRRCTSSTSVCATCRSQAVVEIAELLELAPAEVQDTLSVLRLLQAGQAARPARGSGFAARSVARCAAARKCWSIMCHTARHPARRDHGRRHADAGIRRMPGRLRLRPLHAGRTRRLHKDLTPEKADEVSERHRRPRRHQSIAT